MRTRHSLAVLAILGAACGGGDRPPASDQVAADSETVVLDSAQAAAAGLALVVVAPLRADTLHLTGTVTYPSDRVSHVGPRTQGRIRRVFVEVGTHVSAGDTLAVLDSPELGAMQSSWLKAKVAREVAAKNLERTDGLARDGIVSQRRRLEVEAEFREREADLASAAQALAASGAEADTAATGLFVLRAPLAGEVVEKHATAGEVAGPEADLFTIGNPDRLWLLLDLFESDLGRVRTGLAARIAADAFPSQAFTGIVSHIGAQVDSVSRTVKIRVEIPNNEHRLKPGMFVRAAVATVAQGTARGVPRAAVQSVHGAPVVFVPTGGGRFKLQRVRLGAERAGGWVELVEGPPVGAEVVGVGSFSLKAILEGAAESED